MFFVHFYKVFICLLINFKVVLASLRQLKGTGEDTSYLLSTHAEVVVRVGGRQRETEERTFLPYIKYVAISCFYHLIYLIVGFLHL